mmetsp:Transcript_107210/g.311422  ORF Transcript_107210/g.311422 Transcript_107210/m.311422 type:complete len:226 (+) Transcript_107210:117-794(+)
MLPCPAPLSRQYQSMLRMPIINSARDPNPGPVHHDRTATFKLRVASSVLGGARASLDAEPQCVPATRVHKQNQANATPAVVFRDLADQTRHDTFCSNSNVRSAVIQTSENYANHKKEQSTCRVGLPLAPCHLCYANGNRAPYMRASTKRGINSVRALHHAGGSRRPSALRAYGWCSCRGYSYRSFGAAQIRSAPDPRLGGPPRHRPSCAAARTVLMMMLPAPRRT